MHSRHYINRNNGLAAGLFAFIAGAAAWAMFGDKFKQSLRQSDDFQDLKRQVYDKASEVKDLTQDGYNTIVDEVSNKYAQAKGISQNELRDLVDDMKWHWRKISRAWKNNHYTNDQEEL